MRRTWGAAGARVPPKAQGEIKSRIIMRRTRVLQYWLKLRMCNHIDTQPWLYRIFHGGEEKSGELLTRCG